MKAKVIAYYLPQFHPTKENDEWWGKGFTEWTNVAKAKPLFKGHKQPHIPADLGFYDLRLPESRELQSEYALKYGISAFCYWDGKELLDLPFKEVVRLKKPAIPFCLAWANHSWYNKLWSSSNSGLVSLSKSKLLMEQKYLGKEDYVQHFYSLLEAFKDERYFKIHGKLVFVIFDSKGFNDFEIFSKIWNELAENEDLPGFYFVAHVFDEKIPVEKYLQRGFAAINLSLHRKPFSSLSGRNPLMNRIRAHFTLGPTRVDYKYAMKLMDSPMYEKDNVYPTIIPNWDHTPRSGRFGRLFVNGTPELFQKHIESVLARIANKQEEDKVVFLKSWNEWGEGNYIEPDLEYGTQYLESLYNALKL